MKEPKTGQSVTVVPIKEDREYFGWPEGKCFLATVDRVNGVDKIVTVLDQAGYAWQVQIESLLLHDFLLCHHHKRGVGYQPCRSYSTPDYGFWEKENITEEDENYFTELCKNLGLDLEWDKGEWIEIVKIDLTNIPVI